MLPIIESRIVSKVERELPEFKVTNHPQGGYTIARRDPGSSIWFYEDAHGSKRVLNERLRDRIAAAMKNAFSGARIEKPMNPAHAQLSLF